MPSSVRFLTPEWIDALDDAGRDAPVPPGTRLTVEQVVTRAGDPPVTFHMTIGDDGIRVRGGPADAPDLTFTQPYEVAVALSRAEINAQAALASELVKLSGALDRVLRQAGALTALDDVFARVRAVTTYE